MNTEELLRRTSFIELGARARARALLDAGSMRELIGPFERLASPWLAQMTTPLPAARPSAFTTTGSGRVRAKIFAFSASRKR